MRPWLLTVLLLLTCLLTPAGGWAATMHVNRNITTSDSNSCSAAQNPSTPKGSIQGGISCMTGGDTLIVHGGTGGSCTVYAEGSFVLPSGSSGAYTTLQVPGGGHLKGGECVHVRPNADVDLFNIDNRHHIIVDGFKLDGGDTSSDLRSHAARKAAFIIRGQHDSNNNIIFRNNEMMRTRHSCLIVLGSQWEFRGNLVHHCGWFCCNSGDPGLPTHTDPETGATSSGDSHGFYFEANNSLITGNTFHHNPAWGIQIYGGSNMDNNIVENNRFSTSRCGMLTMQGQNHIVRNNLEYNDGYNDELDCAGCAQHFSGTGCGSASGEPTTSAGIEIQRDNQHIVNNTLYGHSIVRGANGMQIQNNIVCNGGAITATGSGTVTPNLTDSCPGFVNAGAGNFHLTSDNTGGVTQSNAALDFDGNTRRTPNSSHGAYDFGGATGTSVATALRFLVQPSTVGVSAPITPAVQVEVLDQFGAHMSSASATISLAIASFGTNPGDATLIGGGPTATASGTATFTNVQLTSPGIGFTLSASASGLTGTTSSTFTVTSPSTACSSPCTIYVNPSALNDSQSCNTVDITHPRKTLVGGLACLTVPGSTLYLRAGTYNECLDTSVTPITGGTSWANPTTIAGYGSETATLTIPPACQALMIFRNAAEDHYIVIDRLILDNQNTAESNGLVYYPGTHHLRFQNGIIRNTFYEGVYIQNASDTEVLNTTIEQSQWYGINVVGSSTRTLLQNLTIRNHAQAGLQVANGSLFTARELTLTGNGVGGSRAAVRVGGSGETGALLANAVIYENYAGIEVLTGASGLKLYNNTLVNNTNAGVTVPSGVTNINLTNTISTGHGGGQNIVNNAGASLTQAAVLTTNPGFVDVPTDNYHLAPTATTALNQGVTLATDVPTDRDGVPRPQGAGYDIGAYECPAPCSAVLPPSGGVQLEAPAWKSGGLLRR